MNWPRKKDATKGIWWASSKIIVFALGRISDNSSSFKTKSAKNK